MKPHANTHIFAVAESAKLRETAEQTNHAKSQADSTAELVNKLVDLDNSLIYAGNQVYQLTEYHKSDTSTLDAIGQMRDAFLPYLARIANSLETIAAGGAR